MSVFALVPFLLFAAAPAAGGQAPGFVSADGGDVPVVAPNLAPRVAGALAPELVADGGELLDGGQAPSVAPRSLSVYKVNMPAEAAVTVGSFGLYFMVDILVKPTLPGGLSCRTELTNGQCDPADLSAFDRYAVGKTSPEWRTFSDVALAASIAVPLLYLGLESLILPTKTPWADFIGDVIVVAEAMAVTATMQTVLKFAFRRPRPDRYLAVAPPPTFDDELSLPSGHVSIVTAATTAFTTTIFLRHPNAPVRWVVFGAGVALSLMTAFARVQSGQHFPTDVITGLLIGGAAGFAIPWIHTRDLPVTPAVAVNPATGSAMLVFSGPW